MVRAGLLSLIALVGCGRCGYDSHALPGVDGSSRDGRIDMDSRVIVDAPATGDGMGLGPDVSPADALAASCRTSLAPNFAGTRCGGSAIDVELPHGCRFEWDFNSCCTVAGYLEVEWDVQECRDGEWVGVDSGADAYRCSSCTMGAVMESWMDTCGNLSAATMPCPSGGD
jgi:hypothetical protein